MTTRQADATDTTRIAIAAEQELFRRGLSALLRQEAAIEVVGESASAGEVERFVHQHRPDVAVIDSAIVDSGTGSLQRSADASPDTRFLLLTSSAAPDTVRRLFEIGASGVISSGAQLGELLDAIAQLLRGDRYLHPGLGARLVQQPEQLDHLTERERRIAELISLGHTNVEVGRMLYVSTRTVETHRAHVMAKLGVHSKAEFVRWALDNRIIGPSPEPAG